MSSDTATIKKIQQKVGVTADGIMGPRTLAAISAAAPPITFRPRQIPINQHHLVRL